VESRRIVNWEVFGMAERVGYFVWTGRVLTVLVSGLFLMSATMKIVGGPQVTEGMQKSGIPEHLLVPLAILEATVTLVYLCPPTLVLGAILLTGYLGGAILTHVRIGEGFAVHIVIGVLIWLGPFLRDERVRRLIPIRWPWK